ncbi:Gfo/Idh/MocA family protein [Alkalicoccus halolimnae]|uniref:Gfo/Idh/MocA family oxidoreductase n=1 Tax=Alkalicoccus halolimnae TaxID=1667239 RepID=A0AAJ8LU22_9BACI|nr:Gfo/Idh/MocA family oxidoreductase [Alkalicoccus halolimnae]
MKEKVGLALVGTWHVHTKGFIDKLNTLSNEKIEWKAVWDHDKDRGTKFAEQLNVPFIKQYEEILNDDAVDAVMIEAETNRHFELIIKAAKAHKHIFTDKVVAVTGEEAEEIREAVRGNNVKCVISHESLTIGAYQYAKHLISAGELGELLSIYFRRSHGMAKTNRLPESWYDRSTAGGGALIDLGVHGLSLLTFLGGLPESVHARMKYVTKREVEDTATVSVSFKNSSLLGAAHTNLVSGARGNLLEVTGTKGSLTILGEKNPDVFVDKGEGDGESLLVDQAVFATEGEVPVNLFIDFVLDQSDTRTELFGSGCDLDTAVTIVKMAEAAYESEKSGKSVYI